MGSNFLKYLRMLILADILGILLSKCTSHLRFSSMYIPTYLATNTHKKQQRVEHQLNAGNRSAMQPVRLYKHYTVLNTCYILWCD